MKNSLLLTAIVFFLTFPASAHHVPTHPHDVTIKVNGLICDFCARTLEKTFGARSEIEKINVDLDTHEVAVDFKPGNSLPNEDISSMITNSGYAIVEIIR